MTEELPQLNAEYIFLNPTAFKSSLKYILMFLFNTGILFVKHIILMFVVRFLYSTSHNLLELDSIKTVPLKKAIVDNLTHISIGIASWLICVSNEKISQPWNIINSLICGVFAGLVDIDHFLMARSIKLDVSDIIVSFYI